MKNIIIAILILLFSVSYASADRNKGRQQKGQKQERKYENDRRGHRMPRYFGQGYRYNHRGHRHYKPKHYRGHWRSWRAWDDHRRHNHNVYRKGRYYRRGGSLYFEFETEDGRFSFSIGR